MSQLSLRIKIAGREYPMKVAPEEEKNVRDAAKMVSDKVRSFKKQFGIDDAQDLLAMVAFDGMIKILSKSPEGNGEATDKILAELNDKLKTQLEDS